MTTITVQEAQGRLGEIIDQLVPGEVIILVRDNRPIARLVAEPAESPRPVPGRGKGMLTIIAEDDEHLKDFADYMP